MRRWVTPALTWRNCGRRARSRGEMMTIYYNYKNNTIDNVHRSRSLICWYAYINRFGQGDTCILSPRTGAVRRSDIRHHGSFFEANKRGLPPSHIIINDFLRGIRNRRGSCGHRFHANTSFCARKSVREPVCGHPRRPERLCDGSGRTTLRYIVVFVFQNFINKVFYLFYSILLIFGGILITNAYLW